MSELNQSSQELNPKQAVNVLIQAARIGQSKGAYSLEHASLIQNAVKVFIPENQEGEEDPALNEEPAEVKA